MVKGKKPQRMCIACRTIKGKGDLIRLVINRTGEAALDPSGKLPGRGAYVCRSGDCFETAIRSNRLQKEWKRPLDQETLQRLIDERKALPDDGKASNR